MHGHGSPCHTPRPPHHQPHPAGQGTDHQGRGDGQQAGGQRGCMAPQPRCSSIRGDHAGTPSIRVWAMGKKTLSREARWHHGQSAAQSRGSYRYPSLSHDKLNNVHKPAWPERVARQQHTSQQSSNTMRQGNAASCSAARGHCNCRPTLSLPRAQHGRGTCLALP